MCDSGDQCYRYWDHCDNIEQCYDGSDEGTTCSARDMIVYLVPLLMLTLISTLIVILLVLRIKGGCMMAPSVADNDDNLVVIATTASTNSLNDPSTATRVTTTTVGAVGRTPTGISRSVSANLGNATSGSSATLVVTTTEKSPERNGIRGKKRGSNGEKELRVTLCNKNSTSHLSMEEPINRANNWWKVLKDKL